MTEAELLAQRQLDAYNKRDIDAFAECYAEDIELCDLLTGNTFCSSREQLIARYGPMFANRPNLHCTLVRRIVCGNFAYDEEHVVGLVENTVVHAVATYYVKDNLIHKAWFVRAE
ncbi:MAG: nuclear transport factor 2 family protein [Candidatus Kapabacteria bacterium]|nr:nuclear transport factor 2 family protein [Candidatus Kapabacteria bacterium]